MSSRAEKRATARMAKKHEARAEREAQGIYTPSSSSSPSSPSSSRAAPSVTGTAASAKKKKQTATTAVSSPPSAAAATTPSQPATPNITHETAAMIMGRVLREVSSIRDNNVTLDDDISLMEQSVHQLVLNGNLISSTPSSTSSLPQSSPTSSNGIAGSDGEHGRKSMREVKWALRKRAERLHYNCMAANEHCMRLFFALDGVTGDASIKTARKDAVQQVQQLSEWIDAGRVRLEALLQVLPCIEVLSPSSATASSQEDDLSALADDLMRDLDASSTSSISHVTSSAAASASSSSLSQQSPPATTSESKSASSSSGDVDAISLNSSNITKEPQTPAENQRRNMTIIGIALVAMLVAYILSTH